MSEYTRISIRPLSGSLGAEIGGAYIGEGMDAETVAEVRRALLQFNVVFLRDQHITSAQYLDFAHQFGEVSEYPFLTGLPDYPDITAVVKLEDETVNFGGIWHTDTSYLETPPMGTMLLARELPPVGGDTIFANGYQAYDALSDGMKGLLGGLVAVASSAKADVSKTREDSIRGAGRDQRADEYLAEHPVVRTHPETDRKSLYQHQVRPEFTCRFSWDVGSLAFWDNRCTLHNPVNDYHGHRRVMHRITLKGDKPA
jgi:taurine dioxygenase